ncbi:MAG: hypothetical protein HYX82_02975 [Chloroflexi bacterium]|nr:hypothetical protein [Chloroflexota bacterium]
MDTKAIEFTLNELLLLERTISYNGPRTVLAVPPITDEDLTRLALKIGYALANVKEEDAAFLSLSEKECWWFRETIDIFAFVGKTQTPEGYLIKTKLYAAILQFELESRADEIPQLAYPDAREVNYGELSSHARENSTDNKT